MDIPDQGELNSRRLNLFLSNSISFFLGVFLTLVFAFIIFKGFKEKGRADILDKQQREVDQAGILEKSFCKVDETKLPLPFKVLSNPVLASWRAIARGTVVSKDEKTLSLTIEDKKGNRIIATQTLQGGFKYNSKYYLKEKLNSEESKTIEFTEIPIGVKADILIDFSFPERGRPVIMTGWFYLSE